MQTIGNSTVSVDTFFLMSGLLASFLLLRELDRNKGKFNVGLYYLHRYLRLTIVYAFILGFIATLIVYVGTGPNWYSVNLFSNNCRNAWWRQFLYSQLKSIVFKKSDSSHLTEFSILFLSKQFVSSRCWLCGKKNHTANIYFINWNNIFLTVSCCIVLHGPDLVPGGRHATLCRFTSLHLSALAMEEMGTYMAGLLDTRLSSFNILRLRKRRSTSYLYFYTRVCYIHWGLIRQRSK
jgi:hypothetical protein